MNHQLQSYFGGRDAVNQSHSLTQLFIYPTAHHQPHALSVRPYYYLLG